MKKKTKKKRTKSKGRRAIVAKKATRKRVRPKPTRKKKVAKKKRVVREAAPGAFSARRSRAGSGRQAGDVQGISTARRADSESVDELVEEGNAFEAGVVAGVEEADSADGREVRTREVPEDDVPGEYLDEN